LPQPRQKAICDSLAQSEVAADLNVDPSRHTLDPFPKWRSTTLGCVPPNKLRLLKGSIDLDRLDRAEGASRERGLESLEREHQLILQAAGEGIYGLDPEGRAIFVNPAAAEMTGHTTAELLGQSMHEVVHHSHPSGEPFDRCDCPIYAAIRDGMVRKSGSESFWRKDGTSFPVEYTSTPIIEGRKVVGAVVVFRDVTARQATEERLRRALEEVRTLKERLQEENLHLKQRLGSDAPIRPFVGQSEGVARVLDLVRRAAPTDVPVLVLGESGTGKELVCRAIHELGPRCAQPLVSVNCAAISPQLIESELFGHERGSFTGAHGRRTGRFEEAEGGTLFLDEVGELPLDCQGKLLRVLQERTYRRVGGERELTTGARIIAATNRDLRAHVEAGKFRADLYYRLYVLPIEVPPLRERAGDVRVLAEHFLRQCEQRWQRRFRGISAASLENLQRHTWPGNVRELQHVIERAVLLCDGPELVIEPIAPSETALPPPKHEAASVAPDERTRILQALEQTRFRISGPHGAAVLLGMHPNTLRYRIEKLRIATTRRS
jgi:PAS domain S-box-containing protein